MVPEVLSTTRTERQTKNGGNMAFTVSTVKYTFYAADGSSIFAVTTGEGMDSADKSTNKAMAAAMKYAMFQTFCIPTEEAANDDPDRETPPESSPVLHCADCGGEIGCVPKKDGSLMPPAQVAQETSRRFGRRLCQNCWSEEAARVKAGES